MFSCAIIGATGMVGRNFIKILEERKLPIKNLYLFASARSAGQTLEFNGDEIVVEELTPTVFDRGIDYALFAVGSDISRVYAKIAAEKGCIVIDNSSAWRMDKNVPLIVPEVNLKDLKNHKGIIANPNCCAVPTVVALSKLSENFGLKRVIISTYQSVSGAGVGGMTDLEETINGNENKHFPYPIGFNLIPHIDMFHEDGYTGEEKKLMAEVKKMLHLPNLGITATTVRVPVKFGHSLSINVTLENKFEMINIRETLKQTPGLEIMDDPSKNIYPMPILAAGKDTVYVGRLRKDESFPDTFNMWVVADNTRKGAASNAVQIMEELIKT